MPVAVLGWFGEGPVAEQLREIGCEIYTFPYKNKLSGLAKLLHLRKLASYIKHTIKADVILPFVSIHSKPVCLVWRWTGARYCWWNQQDEGRRMYKSANERRALESAVHITSNSRAGAEFLSQSFNLPLEKIIVYNNGTPIPESSKLTPMWREKLGLEPNQLLVSMLANITVFKDHETLLKAWRKVVDAISAPTPVLALAGHHKEAEHVLKMKSLAFDLGLGHENVRFLGAIDTTNELLAESDLVVHSSVKEGCPNAVCEAMALGRAVVATDISGSRQALGDENQDFIYAPEHDFETLAQRLITLLKDKNLRDNIGQENLERIRRDFSIDGMNRFLLSLTQPTSA